MAELYQSRILSAKINAGTREVRILVPEATGNPDIAAWDTTLVPAFGQLYSEWQTAAPAATVVGLKCWEIRAERYSPTVVLVTAVFSTIPYGSPSTRLLKDTPNSYIVEVDLSANMERMFVSLPATDATDSIAGLPIGPSGSGVLVYRPGCVIKITQRVSDVPWTVIFATTGKVNSAAYLSQPAGSLLYLGAQVRDNADEDFLVSHVFKYAPLPNRHLYVYKEVDRMNPEAPVTFEAERRVYPNGSFAGLGITWTGPDGAEVE